MRNEGVPQRRKRNFLGALGGQVIAGTIVIQVPGAGRGSARGHRSVNWGRIARQTRQAASNGVVNTVPPPQALTPPPGRGRQASSGRVKWSKTCANAFSRRPVLDCSIPSSNGADAVGGPLGHDSARMTGARWHRRAPGPPCGCLPLPCPPHRLAEVLAPLPRGQACAGAWRRSKS